MISNEKTRWIYIREILNLTSSTGHDFGRGVKLLPLKDDVIELFDKEIPRLYVRWQDKQYWIINYEPLSKSDLIDGDLGGALRIIPQLMLIVVSPFLKFGPSVFLKVEEEKTERVAILYDRLHTPMAHFGPDDFISITEKKIKQLQQIFEKFLKNPFSNILDIPRDRFIRACLDKKEDDGIIDLAIAFECLYGGQKEDIVRRGASFEGASPQERENIYIDLTTLFWARNEILHKGIARPNITLENGRALDAKGIRNGGLHHCAQVLKKILMDPFRQGKMKKDILKYFEHSARSLKNEFDSYKLKYQSITKNRN
jgi:hypothetical protein